MSGIASLVFALFLAQAAPTPVMPAGWQASPASDASTYASFKRSEAAGESTATGSRQTCDCQPDHFAAMLSSALASHATVNVDVVTACGAPAERINVSNLGGPTSKRGMEILAFRSGPDFYTLQYVYPVRPDEPQVSAVMSALCPPVASPTPTQS